jgi:hypothetical protein
VVVLVTLAVMALAHGMLLSARTELAASAAGARHLEVQAAAAGALALALRVRAAAWMDSVPLWEARPVVTTRLGRADAVGAFRRLEREAWLAEGSARMGGGPPAHAGALVWMMDPVARVSELQGVLQVGADASVSAGGVVDGVVDGVGFTRAEPPLPAGACARWRTAIDSIVPPFLPPVAGRAFAPDGPGLGLLAFDSLMARVAVSVSGPGAAEPVERLGECQVGSPWNWGDPERPASPCGGHLALRSAPRDLRVEGGAGQGILIVDGDVTFAPAARYYGLVIVSGTLRLEGGALVTGAALASRGAHVAEGATVRGSACWVARALAAHRGTLGRTVLLDASIGPM